MTDLNVEFKLERIHCHDEGDGVGRAEPYLWTCFFKVDGDTIVGNSEDLTHLFLQGPPTVVTTPGNHGNLVNTDVDKGDDVAIPAIVGEYHTVMKQIPLSTPIGPITEFGGLIGCVVVLMEEDNTRDSAVERGHEAFDRSVRDKLAEVVGKLELAKPQPSDEDIQSISKQIGEAVRNAIGNSVNAFEFIVALGNNDDQIGSGVFRFLHKDLAKSGGVPIPFRQRWDNEGDWEIFGHIQATPIRRPEPKCCDELRKEIAELKVALGEQKARIDLLERPHPPS